MATNACARFPRTFPARAATSATGAGATRCRGGYGPTRSRARLDARSAAFVGRGEVETMRVTSHAGRSTRRARDAVVVAGKKKLRGLVKKGGDAAEAVLTETARLRAERSIIDGELREIRETRGEVVMDPSEIQLELLREIRLLSAELRELKEEVRAATRGGDFNAVATPANAQSAKSDDDMMAMLGVGGEGFGFGDAAVAEQFEAPLLDVTQWRGDGTDRSGEWPYVKQNEDDIYLMTTIHRRLNEAGFWAGEDDEDDMYFGQSTKDALLYFQANAGLSETGLVDPDTWRALLGDEEFRWGPPPGAIAFDESRLEAAQSTTANPDHFMAEEDYAPDEYDPFGHEDERGEAQGPSFETSGGKSAHKWPVLREEDGGMEVHKMQVILAERGYDSGEEDMEYWYFGSATSAALLTFQASERLNETGITDLATWRALLSDDLTDISPAEALAAISDGDYPHDLARTDKVFLLGEQRYED